MVTHTFTRDLTQDRLKCASGCIYLVICVFDCTSNMRRTNILALNGSICELRVHTWHKNMHSCIEKHPHQENIQHTSCLYFYDICIITCQSDCRMNWNWFVSLELSIELDRNDFSVAFPSMEMYYGLVLTAMKETDGLDWSELGGKALHCYHCCLWASDCLLCWGFILPTLTCIHSTQLFIAHVKKQKKQWLDDIPGALLWGRCPNKSNSLNI